MGNKIKIKIKNTHTIPKHILKKREPSTLIGTKIHLKKEERDTEREIVPTSWLDKNLTDSYLLGSKDLGFMYLES